MNAQKTFKNQELFSFAFKDETPDNHMKFQIALTSNYKEQAKAMLSEDKEHKLKPNEFAEFQLNIDVGIMMFYTTFIKVMAPDKRKRFLDYQFDNSGHKLTFLYRLESLATCNYWYMFGENSHYDPEVERWVMDWIKATYKKGIDHKPSKIIKL